jgi:hypothetical protein
VGGELLVVLVVLGEAPRAARAAEGARGLVGEGSSLACGLVYDLFAPEDLVSSVRSGLCVVCGDLVCPAGVVLLELVLWAV